VKDVVEKLKMRIGCLIKRTVGPNCLPDFRLLYWRTQINTHNDSSSLLVFRLDDQRYAFFLSIVVEVVRAVEITPLPSAPDIILGIINVRGTVVPVVNLRTRFRLPERNLEPDDRIIIARTV